MDFNNLRGDFLNVAKQQTDILQAQLLENEVKNKKTSTMYGLIAKQR